jgi:glucose-1-phosphate thymidylyltransferase
VQTLEQRQGVKIACIEEIAFHKGFIDVGAFQELIAACGKTEYGAYLQRVLRDHHEEVAPRLAA